MHQSASGGRVESGLQSFLVSGLETVFRRRTIGTAVLLFIALAVFNVLILRQMPAENEELSWAFIITALLRLGGIAFLCVALLRLAVDSSRRTHEPDGAFWLYLAVSTGTFFLLTALLSPIIGDSTGLLAIIAQEIVMTVLLAPLSAWMVALAVARPLAWQPQKFVRSFGLWLPHLLFWSLVLTPFSVLHAWLNVSLIDGTGEWFWPLVLLDAALAALLLLATLSLGVAAYRRVAES